MFEIAITQQLNIHRFTDHGIYLAQEAADSPDNPDCVLLPKNQVPDGLAVGDSMEVFVYLDSSDRPIATTSAPMLQLGETALLEVKENTQIGAFLDWGLPKDLLLPFQEMTARPKTGDKVLVALYKDKSSRLCATMKVYPYLKTDSAYQKDDLVEGLVYEIVDNFGAFVAIDDKFSARVPKSEILSDDVKESLLYTRIAARVAMVLPDGKLTLTLRKKAYEQSGTDADLIMGKLLVAGGSLPYHDKSTPEEIAAAFGIGKKAFKRAIGTLYKERKIVIASDGISVTHF
jgi:predicted RNA-binding protein (virulence factor B family)